MNAPTTDLTLSIISSRVLLKAQSLYGVREVNPKQEKSCSKKLEQIRPVSRPDTEKVELKDGQEIRPDWRRLR